MMAKRDVRLMSRIPRPTSAENTPFFSAPQSGQVGGTSSTHQISAELLNLAALISTELSSRTTWGPLICFKSTKETQGFPSSHSKPADLRRTPCASCQTSALRWGCGTTGKTHLTTAEILPPVLPLHLPPARGQCYAPEPGSSMTTCRAQPHKTLCSWTVRASVKSTFPNRPIRIHFWAVK